jgi:thiol-disulfide isomerase/thioredoxin
VSSQSSAYNALGSGPRQAARMDLSGHERDKLFLSLAGQRLVDVSYLSGTDGIEDGRALAVADLDRDGHDDLIVVNRNAPLLRVYLNRVGAASGRHFVGIRLEGAAQAVGARVAVTACGTTQTRELSLGTGLAVTNSPTLTFGVDRCASIDELVVRFRRGERRSWSHLAADRLYRVVEGKGLKELPGAYAAREAAAAVATDAAGQALLAGVPKSTLHGRRRVLIDLFASWCQACARQAPRLDRLAAFDPELEIVGITVEPSDDEAALARLPASPHPRLAWNAPRAAAVRALMGEAPPLPSSLIVDVGSGAVLWRGAGLPTRSDLARVANGAGSK